MAKGKKSVRFEPPKWQCSSSELYFIYSIDFKILYSL